MKSLRCKPIAMNATQIACCLFIVCASTASQTISTQHDSPKTKAVSTATQAVVQESTSRPFIAPFSTGFEPDESTATPPNEITWMTFDNTSPIPGATPWSMNIYYEFPGNFNDRHAQITQDPINPSNSVLYLWLQNATIDAGYLNHTKGRIQSGFPAPLINVVEIYSKQRMFIHNDLNLLHNYPANADQWWRDIPFYDFWTGAAWEGHPNPSNIGFSIFPYNGNFYFYVLNRAMPELAVIWEYFNIVVPVPVGEWFTIEIAYKMGDVNTGRIVVTLTPESTNERTVIFDITDITYDPAADLPGGTGPVPVTHWNPQKIYASDNAIHFIRDNGGVAQLYFDDFEFSGSWPNNWP